VEFRLLGPLEVSVDGKNIELRSNRVRVVLALLLLHSGRVVQVTRLVDALWDDCPPTTAKGQVQTCISALRHQFAEFGAGDLVSTTSVGYVINIPPGSLDIAVFEELTARARVAAEQHIENAVRDFRAALELWRGPAAADVNSRDVQAMAARLNEDRVRVVEECIQLELALGRHHDLIGELSALVIEHPLRELLRAQHILALYRSGRQAEALESFQQIRRILRDELGLEPGGRLRSLQSAILAKDATLDAPPETTASLTALRVETVVVPRQLPAAISDFTGREELLDDLVAILTTAEPDGRKYLPVASLNGKGGVGKTALALQAAQAVRGLYPDGQLFVQLRDADGQPVSAMELMASVLRSLGLPLLRLPEELPERTAIYRSWLGEKKVLIVLDDAHSASQVLALIPGSPRCGVIVTSVHQLYSLPGAEHFEVNDFDEDTGIAFLARLIGSDRIAAEPAAALTLVGLCDYLPLAIRIVAARLATRRHWSIGHMIERMNDESRRLDELAYSGLGIRTTLATAYSEQSVAARRLFLRLGLLGTADFAGWVSAPLLDVAIETANDLLEELVEARLVEVRESEDGSSRFRCHDLVRIYALERLAADEPPDQRAAALERLLGCWLSLAVEGHRRIYGGDFAVLHGAADLWRLPAQVCDQLLASPLSWFKAERAGLVLAVTQAAQVRLDEVCWDLAVTAVTLFESEHLVEDWQKTHEIALHATRQAGNVRGEAAVLYSLGNLAHYGRLREAPRYLEPALRAFEQLADTHGRALALSALAFADRQDGRSDRALERYGLALVGYRAAGDGVGEADALNNMAQIQMDRENYDQALELLEQAFALGQSLGAHRVAAQVECRFGEYYLRIGDVWRAERSFHSALEMVRNAGDLVGEIYALIGLGTVRTLQGRYEQAQDDLSAALSLSRHMTSGNLVNGRILLALAELYLDKDGPESAVPYIGEALAVFSEVEPTNVWRARVLELKARADEQANDGAAAAAARRQALELAGGADTALSRRLRAALESAPAPPEAGPNLETARLSPTVVPPVGSSLTGPVL
jgi:DNA-binding SARP family transcriptional activator/tetratricopeptide (TPR) repeat protein